MMKNAVVAVLMTAGLLVLNVGCRCDVCQHRHPCCNASVTPTVQKPKHAGRRAPVPHLSITPEEAMPTLTPEADTSRSVLVSAPKDTQDNIEKPLVQSIAEPKPLPPTAEPNEKPEPNHSPMIRFARRPHYGHVR